MSIASLTRRVKNEVTCHGLWKKTSTAKSRGSVSNFIMSYLDETSKPDALAEARKVGYDVLRYGPKVPLRQGIDYLTKEEKGKVRAYGFLRDDVTAIGGTYAHHMRNDDRVIACHRAWMSRLALHPGVKKHAHKYVLSLDPRFCELMGAAGKDIDAMLIQGVRTVMRRFQENYYPGDRLGYLVGIHHDTKQVHAHVMLFPFTEGGQNLRVTDSGPDKRFSSFNKTAEKFVRDYFTVEFDNPLKASERPIDSVMQARTVSHIAWTSFPARKIAEGQRMSWVVAEKKRLLALPDAELRKLLSDRFAEFTRLHDQEAPQFRTSPAEAEAKLGAIRYRRGVFEGHLQRSTALIVEIKGRQQANRVELQEAQKALSNFRFFTARSGAGIALSSFQADTAEKRRWLKDFMADANLGGLARASLGKPPLYPIIAGMQERGLVTTEFLADTKRTARDSRDLLSALFKLRIEELEREREKLHADLKQAYTRREGVLAALDSYKIVECLAKSAAKGRKPMFLEQVAGLDRLGIDLPILCRALGPDDLVGKRSVEQPASFAELNRKIMDTLRAFQGTRTHGDTFEVDRYFRTIHEAVTNTKQRKEEAEREMKEALEKRSVEEYLLGQNTRQATKPGTSPGTTLKYVKQAPEFDI